MAVERDRRDWQELAELDPYWAALTDSAKRSEGWNPEQFAASGREEVRRLLAYAEHLGHPVRRGAALDFGCGPGRVTRALAETFGSVVGVDVSESMVATARELVGDAGDCRFVAGTAALAELGGESFDLVYSNLVLQHVSDAAAVHGYIREFVRVLAPGGLIAFQLPSHLPRMRRLQPRRRLYGWMRRAGIPAPFLHRRLRLDPIGVYAVDSAAVLDTLEGAGANVLSADEEPWPGGVRSATYFATR